MAKISNELRKFIRVSEKIRLGTKISDDDLKFYTGFLGDGVDEARVTEINNEIDALKAKGEKIPPDLSAVGYMVIAREAMQSPEYKNQLLSIAENTESKRISQKFADGVNLLLAGSDIAQSINQINESKKGLSNTKRPSRPAVPQRDQYLQQALRQSQEGTFDAERAIAPVNAQIQNQYLTDIANAKTASTGQAGAFGAYAQQAADRRNEASANLAPIQDQIRAREQQRTDNLLGMRANETQQMFQNQASLYPYDLQQYNNDIGMYGNLGATGRANLRDTAYSLGQQLPDMVARTATRRKYDALRNSLGNDAAEIAKKSQAYQNKVYGNPDADYTSGLSSDDTYGYWNTPY